MYRKFGKRLFDIFVSTVAIIVLFPLMLAVAVLIRIKLGSPVIFTQERPGLNERIFKLYKFRTMTDKRDKSGALLPDAERLTGFGRALRATSLDELPELWNILKGDMSIVGPRPLAVQYLPYYTEHEEKRHLVRPGLTGLAQVNGRNAIKWEERLELDVEYTKEITFFKDLQIIINTVKVVVKAQDIGERGKGVAVDFDKYRRGEE